MNHQPEQNSRIRLTLGCIFCIISSFIILSCGPLIPYDESWEGIRNSTLRVFIQYDSLYDNRQNNNLSIKEQLLDSGRNRAEALLISYIRMHVVEIERINACQQQIAGIVANGTMRFWKCHEDFCTAYIDFDVKDFLDTAEPYKKR